MNFSILLGLCVINLIHGKYLLVEVDDRQNNSMEPNGNVGVRRSEGKNISVLRTQNKILCNADCNLADFYFNEFSISRKCCKGMLPS